MIISKYEASTIFNAIKDGIYYSKDNSSNYLIEEIENYNLIEDKINNQDSLKNMSEQMVLMLHKNEASKNNGISYSNNKYNYDEYVGYDFQQLSYGLKLNQNYLNCIEAKLNHKKKNIVPTINDLLNTNIGMIQNFIAQNEVNIYPENLNDTYSSSRLQNSVSSKEHSVSMGNSFNRGNNLNIGRRQGDATGQTEASMRRSVQPHRGIVSVAYDKMDLAEKEQAKDEEKARLKALRIGSAMRLSQSISPFTGSRYTKTDTNLQDSTLLNSTESRNHHMQVDSSPMTIHDRDRGFKSSLRVNYYDKQSNNPDNSNNKSHDYSNIKHHQNYGNYNNNGNFKNMSNDTNYYQDSSPPIHSPEYRFSPSVGTIQKVSPRFGSNDQKGFVNQSINHNLNQRNLNNSQNISHSTTKGRSPSKVKKAIDNNVQIFPDHLRVKMRQKNIDVDEEEIDNGSQILDTNNYKYSVPSSYQHENEYNGNSVLNEMKNEKKSNVYRNFDDNEKKIVDENVAKLVQRYHHYFTNNKHKILPHEKGRNDIPDYVRGGYDEESAGFEFSNDHRGKDPGDKNHRGHHRGSYDVLGE